MWDHNPPDAPFGQWAVKILSDGMVGMYLIVDHFITISQSKALLGSVLPIYASVV